MAYKDTPENIDMDFNRQSCFLTKLESDLQQIFDQLRSKFKTGTKCFHVKNVLKKGSLYHKGDFFLSLRSDYIFFTDSVKRELLDELKKISYIRESQVSEDGNLILCVDRPAVFRSVLNSVVRYGNQYGMQTSTKTFLILVHNEVFKNFDALRIAVIANHLISFLTATGAKVYVNEFRKDAHLEFKEVTEFSCDEKCLKEIKTLCEVIENSAKDSDCCSVAEGTESINIDLKKFVKSESSYHGADADNIKIERNMENSVVNQSAFTLHFHYGHVIPDTIIHVCSFSQSRKIINSGLLIEMLDLLPESQIFLTCQTTVLKDNDDDEDISVDTFVNHQKQEIAKAMNHKFHSSTLTKETRDMYLKTLVDASAKFYFLRAGTNVPLKIDFINNEKNVRNNKDGIFIQYNFARLSNLFNAFESKVEEKYYEKLPSIDEIDFRLLKFEEEWDLLNFILSYPRLVQEIFCSIVSKHLFPVSKIYIMLIKLCSSFSVYYSRIRILSGPQPQLQRVMFARLWLLKGVHQIMFNSFTLLNIKGLNKM